MKKHISKFVALFLSLALVVSALPLSAIALDNSTLPTSTNAINNSDYEINNIVNDSDVVNVENTENIELDENRNLTEAESKIATNTQSSPAPLLASSAETFISGYYTYTVNNCEATIIECDTSIRGKEEIPSTLGGYSVTGIGDWAFQDCTGLVSLMMPNCVTVIGRNAFYKCTSLRSITIPDGVTKIKCFTFYGCSGLTSLTIPNSVTNIEGSSFYGCSGLTSITIPDSVTSIGGYALNNTAWYNSQPKGLIYIGKVAYQYKGAMPNETSITLKNGTKGIAGFAFSGCEGLTNITIPDSVTNIDEYVFKDCTELTNITIPVSVTSIGDYAFYGCSGLTNIIIPDSVICIGSGAFSGCKGLINLTVPFIGSKNYLSTDPYQKPFGYIFGYSEFVGGEPIRQEYYENANGELQFSTYYIPSSLKKVTITKVNNISYGAFSNCSKIESITLPNSVTSIGDYAFCGCTSLISITIPNSITSISNYAFYGCTNLQYNTYGNAKYLGNTDNPYLVLVKAESTKLTSCTVSNNTKLIAAYAFSSCTNLTSITITDSVRNIDAYAFKDCTGLLSVNLTDIVAWCGIAFVNSYSNPLNYAQNLYVNGKLISNLVVPNGVKNIATYAFFNCRGLTSVTIDKSVENIGSHAFSGCTSLISITIPNSITSIGSYAFNGCTGLTSITIPSSVTSIGSDAFSGCTGLTSITIPSSVTSIGSFAFNGCTGLTSITIPSSVTSIGSYAFNGCTGLTSITIPSSVTSIGSYVFSGCAGLTSITIPNSVTSIEYWAFSNCSSLKTVNYSGTQEQWQKITIGSGNTYLTNATRYYNGHTLNVRFVDIYGNELFDTVEQFISSGDSYSVPVPELEHYFADPETVSGTMPDNDLTITVVYYEKTILSSGKCGDNITWKLYADGDLIIKGNGDMPNYSASGAPWYENAGKVINVVLDSTITSIGNYAFENCTNLSNIDFGYSLKSIGVGAFKGCASIKTVLFPSTVTSIGDLAFAGCTKMTSVIIPDTLKIIGAKAFNYCTAIKTVRFGSGVETVGSQAFDGCPALSEIYFYGKPVSATNTTFGTVAGKVVYYYSSVSGWKEQIIDGKWNGYTAIPYNSISKQTTDGVINPYIIKVVDKNKVPLEGATVVLGSASQTTNKDGMAYFAKPNSAVNLTASCSNHITYNDTSYKSSDMQLMDIIVLSDKPSVLQGVRCNDESIASSVYTLNCNTSDNVNISVSGYSKYKIYKYELLQGNRVLQTVDTDSTSCTFSVKASAFEEGSSVFAKMYTSDGNYICQALNIDVVKIADISKSTLLDELSSLNLMVDFGDFGKVTMPLNFRNDNKALIYTSVDKRTIRVGINLDVVKLAKNFKKDTDGSLKAYMQKQVDSALKKKEAKPTDSVDVNVCGYLEIEYLGNGQYYVKTCYVKVAVKISVGFNAQASYFGLVGVYFKAKLSGEASLALTVTKYQPEEGFGVSDLTFAMEDKLTLEAGVFILFKFGTASVYGSGTMGFEIQIIPVNEIKHVYVKAEAGVKWSLLWGLVNGSHKFWSGTIYEWPEGYSQNTLKAMYASALYSAYSDPDNYSINDRSYLENRSEWLSTQKRLLKALSSPSGYYDLQTDVYSAITPKVVTCGDTTVMVWLDDNASRDLSNYQTLYYSVYNKNANTWSAPVQLDNNNTFDCEFDLYTDGKKIYVLYTEQKTEAPAIEELNIEDADAIVEYVANIEVRFSEFENGAFSEPIAITDNAVCETLPSLNTIDGVLTAVWNVTDMLGLAETTTMDTIYISKYIDGAWTVPVSVADNQNMISSVAIGNLSGQQYTAYIIDADNSKETTDDIALILVDTNGNALQIDSGTIGKVSFEAVAGQEALVWNNDGKIYYIFSADGDIICSLPDSSYIHSDYNILALDDGQTLLTFVQEISSDDKTGSDVFGVYIDEYGYYGSVVKLTDAHGYVDHYDVTEIDGRIVVVLTDSVAEFVGEEVTSTTDLRYLILDLNADISIKSADYDIYDVKTDSTFEINVEIENTGWKDIDGVKVNLYDENNQIIYQAEKALIIKSGETVTDTIEIHAPVSLDLGNYVLEIIPNDDVRDSNLSDNSQLIVLAFSDIHITVEQKIIGYKSSLLLFVKNDGNVATAADIEVYSGAEQDILIDTIHIDCIGAGETLQLVAELDGLLSENDVITCIVSAESYDPCIENNSETISLFRVKSESYVAVSGNTVENPELSSNVILYDKYTDDTATITVLTGSEHFAGITGLQNGVDYSVTDNVITLKESYLMSLPLGDNEIVFEFDYGSENTVFKTLTITVSDTSPITITGIVEISGKVVVGNTVIANVTNITPLNADFSYQWKLDGVLVGEKEQYTIPLDAFEKKLSIFVVGQNGFAGEISTSNIVDYSIQEKPNKPILQNISSNSISVAIVPGVEYSLDGISWQLSGSFVDLKPAHKYSIFARYARTETSYASETVEISATTLKKNAENPVATEVVEKTDTTVKLKCLDGYEYRCNNGEWQSSNEFFGLCPNTEYTFYQRIAETDDTYASEPTVGISITTLIYKFSLSGTVVCFGESTEPVTVKLYNQKGEMINSTTTVTGQYLIEEIISGTYTIEISKLNHVARKYEITGKDSKVIQDVKIHLLGDINGDGRVNITDVGKANAHAKKTSLLTGYEFDCANVNGDSTVNITDVGKINAHAKKKSLLW